MKTNARNCQRDFGDEKRLLHHRRAAERCQHNITDHAMEMIVYEILENSKKFHPSPDPHVDVCIEGHSNDDIRFASWTMGNR